MIDHVQNLEAHENERRKRQIKAEMHDGLEPNVSCGPQLTPKAGNQTQYLPGDYSAEILSRIRFIVNEIWQVLFGRPEGESFLQRLGRRRFANGSLPPPRK